MIYKCKKCGFKTETQVECTCGSPMKIVLSRKPKIFIALGGLLLMLVLWRANFALKETAKCCAMLGYFDSVNESYKVQKGNIFLSLFFLGKFDLYEAGDSNAWLKSYKDTFRKYRKMNIEDYQQLEKKERQQNEQKSILR